MNAMLTDDVDYGDEPVYDELDAVPPVPLLLEVAKEEALCVCA